MSEFSEKNILSEKKRPKEGKIFGEPGEEKEKELTREERYVLEQTDVGKVFDWIWRGNHLKFQRADIEKVGIKPKRVGRIMKTLLGESGLIEYKKVIGHILVTKLHPEKLEEFFWASPDGRILKVIEENPGVNYSEIRETIRETLRLGHDTIRERINNMRSAGWISRERYCYYFTTETKPEERNAIIKRRQEGKAERKRAEKKELSPEEKIYSTDEYKILKSLKEGSDFSLKQINKETGVSYPKILEALKKLSSLEIVEIKGKLVEKIHPENLKKLLDEEIKKTKEEK